MSLISSKALLHSRLMGKSSVSSVPLEEAEQFRAPAVHNTVGRAGSSSILLSILRLAAWGTTPGRPRGLLVVWPVWERVAHWLWPTSIIPQSEFGVLELRVVSYCGRPLQLPGPSIIKPGALIGELHCNNRKLLKALTVKKAVPLHLGRCELRSLAIWALENDSAGSITAFYGTSYMPLIRLGFTRYDHPAGPKAWMDQLFMIGLLALYSPDGLKRLKRGRIHLSCSPPQMWISRRELLSRYGPVKWPDDNTSSIAETIY